MTLKCNEMLFIRRNLAYCFGQMFQFNIFEYREITLFGRKGLFSDNRGKISIGTRNQRNVDIPKNF